MQPPSIFFRPNSRGSRVLPGFLPEQLRLRGLDGEGEGEVRRGVRGQGQGGDQVYGEAYVEYIFGSSCANSLPGGRWEKLGWRRRPGEI